MAMRTGERSPIERRSEFIGPAMDGCTVLEPLRSTIQGPFAGAWEEVAQKCALAGAAGAGEKDSGEVAGGFEEGVCERARQNPDMRILNFNFRLLKS